MNKDLTKSLQDRQNILNNRYAIEKAEQRLALGGVIIDGESFFTKQQVKDLYDISDATVERYIATYADELKTNGYSVLKGADLDIYKRLIQNPLYRKTNALGVFSFRAVLNLGMLLTDSERAKLLRSRILDIVLEVFTEKSGGYVKHINQCAEDFLTASFQESTYRKRFTEAINTYIEGSNWKYARLTNLIYESIFKENTQEYKKILRLAAKDEIRDTMYSEVLNIISSFESGVAYELKKSSIKLNRKLTLKEAENLVISFKKHPLLEPMIIDARAKMASRDLCFRDALHNKLKAYIQSVPEADFERFLGEKSKSLEKQLSSPETLAVLKRLKDR